MHCRRSALTILSQLTLSIFSFELSHIFNNTYHHLTGTKLHMFLFEKDHNA